LVFEYWKKVIYAKYTSAINSGEEVALILEFLKEVFDGHIS